MQLLITDPHGSASTVELTEKSLSLGRAVDNDLAYPDDPALSRRHLCIDPIAGGWVVRDCGSRNGTTLNDSPLERPHRLRSGDRISVGHLTIDVNSRLEPFVPKSEPVPPSLRNTTIVTTLDEILGRKDVQGHAVSEPALGSTRVVSALIHAGQELAGHRPINELFEVILDLALSAVEARRGVILTAAGRDANTSTPEPDELSVRASRGEGFSLSTAVRSQVLRNKTSLIISDAQFDAALRDQKSIVAQRVRSIMAVPLQTADRVIGLIYVDNGSLLRPFSREDLDLLTVMANVAAIRIEHARLALIEQAEQLMQVELDQAYEIQRTLLPSETPQHEGCELAGYNLPCRAVGGDYYDFLPYHDGRVGLVVADVCGKGMPAAIMMSSLQARIQMLAESDPDPAQAVTALNRNLAGRFPLGRFITAFYGVLDPKSGRIDYTNAGHNYPLILRSTGEIDELRGGGMVLGLLPDNQYTARHVYLNSGDLLVLFSDGVTEAARPTGEQFGERALAQFLQKHQSDQCSTIIPKLVNHVRSWSGATVFNDDFTVVLLRRVETIAGL